MQRARKAILRAGGADAVNSFTRFYLALLGQISYDQCPAVPPEMMLLPKWFPINIYSMSAWTRTIVVPLSIMWAHRPAPSSRRESAFASCSSSSRKTGRRCAARACKASTGLLQLGPLLPHGRSAA